MPDTNSKLRVASIQMEVISGEPSKNIARAEALLYRAAQAGVQAVLLPELWTTGYALDRFAAIARDHAGETVEFLKKAARKHNMTIVGGSFPTEGADGVYSTCYVISAEGEVLSAYSKEHLFPLLNEPQYLRAGSPGAAAKTPHGKWGTLICFDIRFPESARQLAYGGVRVLWVPAEWPMPRLEHWRTLLRARAIENQLFVVASNRCDSGDNTHWGGHSMIIDPWGNILAEAEDLEAVLVTDLELGMVDEVRARIPCFEVVETDEPTAAAG